MVKGGFPFAEWLKQEMDTRGLDKVELEEATGLSRATIAGYLKRIRKPTMESFELILDAFGLEMQIVKK